MIEATTRMIVIKELWERIGIHEKCANELQEELNEIGRHPTSKIPEKMACLYAQAVECRYIIDWLAGITNVR